jgi:hypothetical protein
VTFFLLKVLVVSEIKQDLGYERTSSGHKAWKKVNIYISFIHSASSFCFFFFCSFLIVFMIYSSLHNFLPDLSQVKRCSYCGEVSG